MKHTKTNIIKLLNAMAESAYQTAKLNEREGDKEYVDGLKRRSWTISEMIAIISDASYFNELYDIYSSLIK